MLFDTHRPTPRVSVGGAPLLQMLASKLHRITVELQRNTPSMCTLEFWDDDLTVVDQPQLRPGAQLKVEAAPASENPAEESPGPLFTGEIVAVEANFSTDGTRALVIGYDKTHRLHRGRKTRTFLQQTDAAVVQQVAGDAGVQVTRVDPPSGVNEYLCQRNQTDWEFLSERAREIGYELGVQEGGLVFRKAGRDPAAGIPQQLELGNNLLTFRPRISSAEQPSSSKVRSFNPVQKMSVMGVGPVPVAENSPGDASLGPQVVGSGFGSAEDVATDTPLDLQPAAMTYAQARRDHLSGTAFEADGTCQGNPAMRPGGTVSVRGAGTRFSGTYTLSTVRHQFDESGYVTRFTVSGRHDRSLLGLTRPGAITRAVGDGSSGGIASPVIAKVTNTTDPMQLGRVKVSFPWMAENAESNWAPVVSPGAGGQSGLQLVPEVGDEVLVAFEQGDVRRPYVLGGVHNLSDMPPQPMTGVVTNGQTNVRRLRTRVGHLLRFDDTQGQESVLIETSQGSKLLIQEGPTGLIQIVDKSGNNEITIDGAANELSLKAAANVKIEARANLEIKATGQLKIEGQAGVEIKSGTTLTAEGTASTTVKGATMTLQASGPLSASGTPIKLN